tara:strand:+ start:625 stop:2499 length:1875 start_codon:yes stop_codon:yes gene_type:complete
MHKTKDHPGRLDQHAFSRRKFVTGTVAGSALLGLNAESLWAQTAQAQAPETLSGREFDLSIGYKVVNYTGRETIATALNDSIPAPILHWREGDEIRLKVTNNLAEDSSVHWHGIILPSAMDGVPGLSFDGIKPGQSFEYRFTVNQSGTYWYHSHSGFQEQTGLYGAIVVSPRDEDPVRVDRDYVVQLSDWSDTSPHRIYARLKKMSHYYNFNQRTAGDLWQEIKTKGITQTWNDRAMWNQMRMSDRDIADVTGYTYTFLMNGNTPDQNWTALFQRGEKIRIRFINSAAMTIFDVRMPGLAMTVVAADGQAIEPVTIDEFRIGVAETYDVIVEPHADTAYTIFAQSIDRTGYALGTLTPEAGLSAKVPAMDPRPVLGHADMGMDMSAMDMEGMDHSQMDMSASNMEGMDHSQMDMSASNLADMDHNLMDHSQMDMPMPTSLGRAGFGSRNEINHVRSEFGPQVDMRSQSPQSGLNDPGIGLRDHARLYNRRVLTYGDIKNLYPTLDSREPEREIELHLTGNMSRYMWSMNGIKFADAEPLNLRYGERVRITLVNDTMMTHPIHLHGMWSELETGDPQRIPRKHTVIVQPGSKISYLVTADARGRWAYHCHLLYHMMGMFREVRVS